MHKFFGVAVGALLIFGLGATAQAAPAPNSQGGVISNSNLVLAAQKERQERQGERQDTRSGARASVNNAATIVAKCQNDRMTQ
jgi:hypothetical protein